MARLELELEAAVLGPDLARFVVDMVVARDVITPFSRELTPTPIERTKQVKDAILKVQRRLYKQGIVEQDTAKATAALSVLKWLAHRLERTEWNEQRPGSWPHYYLRLDKGAEGEPAVSGGLKDGTFRKNLKALALKHLGLAAPPQSPSPPVGGCGGGGAQPPPPPAAAQPAAAGLPPPTGPLDLDTLRNDRNKLREVLDQRRRAEDAAAATVMGTFSRRLMRICESAVGMLQRVAGSEDDDHGALDIARIVRVFEAVRKSTVQLGKDQTFAMLGPHSIGKSTALSVQILRHMDLSAYAADPYPNDLVRLLPALEHMMATYTVGASDEYDEDLLLELATDPAEMLVVNMPPDYAADVAEKEYKRSLGILKRYGEDCKLSGLRTLLPSMLPHGQGTTQVATCYSFYSYGLMVADLMTVEQVQDKASAFIKHLAMVFRQAARDGGAGSAKARWSRMGDNGKPEWYNECVGENDEDADEESEELEDGEVQTVEKIKRMKEAELEVLRDWYLEACGTQLPWDADKTTGIPFIGTDKDKVPVRLARLLRDRRFISCCGPKAPPPAAADQTAAAEEEQQQQQQPKPGCQVLLWLADIQVLLNNLSGIDQYKAAAERIKSCLPTELSGVEDWAHLMAVLKMPVRIFYPSLSLAAVGGLEDLPGAGAEEAHDSVSSQALTDRITTAFLVSSKGLNVDKGTKAVVMQSFVPAMVTTAADNLAAAMQAAAAQPAAAAGGSAAAVAAATSPFRAPLPDRKVVLVHMPEKEILVEGGERASACYLQQRFEAFQKVDKHFIDRNVAAWDKAQQSAARTAWKNWKDKWLEQQAGAAAASLKFGPDERKLVLEKVTRPPSDKYYPLLEYSLSHNPHLCGRLQQVREEAAAASASPSSGGAGATSHQLPSVDELVEYCNSQFVLRQLVAASKGQLDGWVDELLLELDQQEDTDLDLDKLLREYADRPLPPILSKSKRPTREQAEMFTGPAAKASEALVFQLQSRLKERASAWTTAIKHAVPSADILAAAVGAWADKHKTKVADPVTFLQPAHAGRHPDANLYNVLLGLCKGMKDEIAKIERDMKADILEFTNKAANVLTQSAVGYFQDCMGMDNEVRAQMQALLGNKLQDAVQRLLERTLQGKLGTVAETLGRRLRDALTDEMTRMLGKLLRSLEASPDEQAAEEVGSKRPLDGARRPVAKRVKDFLRHSAKGAPGMLRRVSMAVVEAVDSLVGNVLDTVETVAMQPSKKGGAARNARISKKDRGQFQTVMFQVVKYCSDRRHAKNPHAKTTKERLDYYKGLLKALKADVMAMGEELEPVVVLTRQPPVRLLDPGLDQAMLEQDRVTATPLGPSQAAGLEWLFTQMSKRDKPLAAADAGGARACKCNSGAPNKALDTGVLSGLRLRRVGVSPRGDRLCSALLVALTGDKTTPGPQQLRLELRRQAVEASLSLAATNAEFHAAMAAQLTAGGSASADLHQWAFDKEKEGAVVDYPLLQGIVQAMNIRLLIFVAPAATEGTPATTPAPSRQSQQVPATAGTTTTPATGRTTTTAKRRRSAAADAAGAASPDALQSPAAKRPPAPSAPPPPGPHVFLMEPLGPAVNEVLPMFAIALVRSKGKKHRLNHIEAVMPMPPMPTGPGGATSSDAAAVGPGGSSGGSEAGPSNAGDDDQVMTDVLQQPQAAAGEDSGDESSGGGPGMADSDDETDTDTDREGAGGGGGAAAGPNGAEFLTERTVWLVIDQSIENADLNDVRQLVAAVNSSRRGVAGATPVKLLVGVSCSYADYVATWDGTLRCQEPKQKVAEQLHEVFYPAAGGPRVVRRMCSLSSEEIQELMRVPSPGTGQRIQLHESLLVARQILHDNYRRPNARMLLLRHRPLEEELDGGDRSRMVAIAQNFQPTDGAWIHVAPLRSVLPVLRGCGDAAAAALWAWLDARQGAQGQVLSLDRHDYWIKPLE